jgi:glycosyltransferase involved in cell wall biosynthesis
MNSQSELNLPLLSIVAIGRNEESNIAKLARSISHLERTVSFNIQTIFVDSASTDNTCNTALGLFDEVYVLEESPWLCAASGRALGTIKARGKWILYLDGDMELCGEFVGILEQLIAKDEDVSGYIGCYIYVFPDGKTILNSFRCIRNGEMAPAIGGASILRRAEVLKAGNWDPSVFSGEEMELYSRLRAGQRSIRFVNVPFVLHHTDKYDPLRYLLRLLHPSFGLGKQWYGMGQILAARIRNRNLLSYIKLEPYPFACWSGIAIGLLCGLAGSWPLGASLAGSTFTLVFATRGWKLLVIHTTKLLPALVGWIKYNPQYAPIVISAFTRNEPKLSRNGTENAETPVC